MPKISIILVNYNYAHYLDERIQSLLNQTFTDFELIIIENGSTDNSLEVIKKYLSDGRIKLQAYPNNAFPYQRWNNGVDLAQGEYLQIVSSDDSCHPQLLEKLSEQLEKHSSVNFAYCQCTDIDDDGKKISSRARLIDELEKERWSKDFVGSGKDECRYMLLEFIPVNAGAALMRRQAFLDAGKFDVRFRLLADHMLFSKIMVNSDVAFIAEPLSYLRRHSNSLTSLTKDRIHLEEKLQVIDFLLKQGVDPPEYFWNTIYTPSVIWWIRVMGLEGLSLEKLQGAYRVYKLLRSIDPRVNSLILAEFLAVLRRKLHLALSS